MKTENKAVKTVLCAVLFIAVSLIFTSCMQVRSAEDTINCFFKEFENSNFEEMKKYCADSFIKEYFHDGDVYSFKNATLKECEKYKNPDDYDDSLECYYVTVTGTLTDKTSLDKNSKEQSFFVVLENKKGDWKIRDFYSGL